MEREDLGPAQPSPALQGEGERKRVSQAPQGCEGAPVDHGRGCTEREDLGPAQPCKSHGSAKHHKGVGQALQGCPGRQQPRVHRERERVQGRT